VSAASSLDEGTIERLLEMRKRGNAVYLALADDTDDEKRIPTWDLPVYLLGGKEEWRELVQTGSDEKPTGNAPASASLLSD